VDFRLACFIDGGYLDKILRDEFAGTRVDYSRLVAALASQVKPGIDVLRTYYYHCLPYQGTPPTPDESQRVSSMQKFLDKIERLPRFQLRLGRLARRGPDERGNYRFEQKMVDVLLSVDLVKLSVGRQITHVALVAGDADFVPAMHIAKDEGVQVWLFYGGKVHHQLLQAADERVRIDQALVDLVRLEE